MSDIFPKQVGAMNRPQPTGSQWVILGDDECIIKRDEIFAASTDGRNVIITLDNGSHVVYHALSIGKAIQELKEIINILLQRNTNENS